MFLRTFSWEIMDYVHVLACRFYSTLPFLVLACWKFCKQLPKINTLASVATSPCWPPWPRTGTSGKEGGWILVMLPLLIFQIENGWHDTTICPNSVCQSRMQAQESTFFFNSLICHMYNAKWHVKKHKNIFYSNEIRKNKKTKQPNVRWSSKIPTNTHQSSC